MSKVCPLVSCPVRHGAPPPPIIALARPVVVTVHISLFFSTLRYSCPSSYSSAAQSDPWSQQDLKSDTLTAPPDRILLKSLCPLCSVHFSLASLILMTL